MAQLQPSKIVLIETYEAPCPHACFERVKVTVTRAEDGRILEIRVKH